MEKLLKFGAKEPIKSAIFIAGIPFLIFVFGCVVASGLTYKNLNPVVMTGGLIAIAAIVTLTGIFKMRQS